MTDVEKVEFDSSTKVATVTMKPGKTITRSDARKAFKGTQYGVSKFKKNKDA